MRISAEQWSVLSRLLDEALEVPQEARECWLESLGQLDAVLKGELRLFLERHARIETSDFLDTLPKLGATEGAAPDASESAALRAGAAIGPYVIEQEIGRGGMGVVWRARRADGLVKRPVALKLLHAGFYSSELLARFARERDILAALTHPNIARLYDAGATESGQPFLALEYVEGQPLTKYCDEHRLDVRRRLDLMRQVLEAVQYAHSHLVIHRDLKPSNILVTAAGQVLLLDFGIAKLVSESDVQGTALTQFGTAALTPDYASPEQIAGEAVSTASDVYSLGVILFELLTGERPYRLRRHSRRALEDAILSSDAMRPSWVVKSESQAAARSTSARRLAAQLRGDLDTIVLKSLKKSPGERYPTADAFKQDLDRFLTGYAVLARADTFWYRSKKLVARNRVAVAAGAAAFLALAAGLAVALVQARRADLQAQIARTEASTAQAVQAFMEDIFKVNSVNQPDPLSAQKTTARELLDIGAQKIDGALLEAPAAKLKVLHTIADLYDDLNLETKEMELSRKRVQIARENFGPMSAELADGLVDLATVTSKESLNNEADLALTEAKRILDARHEFRSLTRAKYEIDMANRLYDLQAGQAASHVNEGIRVLRMYPPSKSLIDALSLKAAIENHLGDYASAKVSAQDAIALAHSPQLEARSFLPFSYMQLAKAKSGQEDLAGAEDSMRHALQESVAVYGYENANTLMDEDALGNLLLGSSRLAEALAVLEKARDLSLRRAAAGDTSTFPSFAMYRYARALILYGRFEEGLATLQTIDEMRRHLETRADLKASLLERRAEGLLRLGHYGDAERLLDEASSIRTRVGQEHTSHFNANALLRTQVLMFRGEFSAARQALLAFSPEQSAPGTVSRERLDLLVARSELDLADGRSESALATATETLALIAASPTRQYQTLWEARGALVAGRAYLLEHRPQLALPQLLRSVELSRQLYDPERSPELSDAQIALANCYLALDQLDQSRSLLSGAEAIQATHRELGVQYKEPLRKLRAQFAADETRRSANGRRSATKPN
jgi:eukaryotic-like serine/threonine-protein kinase